MPQDPDSRPPTGLTPCIRAPAIWTSILTLSCTASNLPPVPAARCFRIGAMHTIIVPHTRPDRIQGHATASCAETVPESARRFKFPAIPKKTQEPGTVSIQDSRQIPNFNRSHFRIEIIRNGNFRVGSIVLVHKILEQPGRNRISFCSFCNFLKYNFLIFR